MCCVCAGKHRSESPGFLPHFDELVGGVLGLLALLCMGRCMTLTPPSHWQVHTSSGKNTFEFLYLEFCLSYFPSSMISSDIQQSFFLLS